MIEKGKNLFAYLLYFICKFLFINYCKNSLKNLLKAFESKIKLSCMKGNSMK